MSGAITNITRGCGRRVKGGVYLEVGVGPNGLPVEAFIVDPVEAINVEAQRALGLSALGSHLVERPDIPGVYDVWDVIGENNYPNIADFLEEARRYGVSRRIASTTDFSKIGPYSRLVLLHAKAAVLNWKKAYAPDWRRICPMVTAVQAGAPNARVPEGHEHPATAEYECAGIWWEDVVGGRADPRPADTARAVLVDMPPKDPTWNYLARKRPDGVIPAYTLGIVATFPLSRIAVVQGGKAQENIVKARKAHIQVDETET